MSQSGQGARVVQLGNDGKIIGIRELGANGGVDLGPNAKFDPKPKPEDVEGTYLWVPNVSGLLQIYNIRVVSLNFTAISRLSPY